MNIITPSGYAHRVIPSNVRTQRLNNLLNRKHEPIHGDRRTHAERRHKSDEINPNLASYQYPIDMRQDGDRRKSNSFSVTI